MSEPINDCRNSPSSLTTIIAGLGLSFLEARAQDLSLALLGLTPALEVRLEKFQARALSQLKPCSAWPAKARPGGLRSSGRALQITTRNLHMSPQDALLSSTSLFLCVVLSRIATPPRAHLCASTVLWGRYLVGDIVMEYSAAGVLVMTYRDGQTARVTLVSPRQTLQALLKSHTSIAQVKDTPSPSIRTSGFNSLTTTVCKS